MKVNLQKSTAHPLCSQECHDSWCRTDPINYNWKDPLEANAAMNQDKMFGGCNDDTRCKHCLCFDKYRWDLKKKYKTEIIFMLTEMRYLLCRLSEPRQKTPLQPSSPCSCPSRWGSEAASLHRLWISWNMWIYYPNENILIYTKPKLNKIQCQLCKRGHSFAIIIWHFDWLYSSD